MTGQIPIQPESVWYWTHGPFRILPILHERLEYADLVRLAFALDPPDAVVVELPRGLQTAWKRAVEHLPQISAIYSTAKNKKTRYWICQPADAFAEASRWAQEHAVPFRCGDLDIDGYGEYRDRVPDPYALWRISPKEMYAAFEQTVRARDAQDLPRARALAYAAQEFAQEGAKKIAIICGMHHCRDLQHALGEPQAQPLLSKAIDTHVVHLAPEGLDEVLVDPPFYIAAYEARRKTLLSVVEPKKSAGTRQVGPFRLLEGGRPDKHDAADAVARAANKSLYDLPASAPLETGPLERLRLQWALLQEAETSLRTKAPDTEIHDWQRRNLAQYASNLARLSGRLVVDLYDLLIACRGCATELYACEVLAVARSYPLQEPEVAHLPTARISAEALFDGVRRLRLAPRHKREKRGRWWEKLKSGRKAPKFPAEWLLGFDDAAICSYPPEDEIIENFGTYLRRKGKTLLEEEQARVLPFSSSLLDGIDVRETIRHWHEGRLWVRERGRVQGGVDSVVIIFDEDDQPGEEKFPYMQTWLGEHDQESDMAFYSTNPEDAVIGPGICRVTYGGLTLCMPPRRMRDVWSDPDYRGAQSKAELLLLAALDYAQEETIVYAAPKAPRAAIQQLARRFGLRILYIPLTTLSPPTLRKIRVMHILAGHNKRAIAKDYIW